MKTSNANGPQRRDIQLLTVADLAELLAVSVRTIHRLNSSGKIPAPLRVGGQLRFKNSEVAAWIEENCPDRKTWEAMKQNGRERRRA